MQPQSAAASLEELRVIVPLFAAILGSLVTLVANHFYTRWRERKIKREQIFRTLMSTRGFKMYQAHVEALCAVEIEWTGAKDAEVRSAWKAYNHHLNKSFPQDVNDPENIAWRNTTDELFADLAVKLGESVGKSLDRTDVKTGTYGPKMWWDAQQEMELLRKGLISVIASGKGLSIPVSVQYDPMLMQQIENSAKAALKSPAPALPPVQTDTLSRPRD